MEEPDTKPVCTSNLSRLYDEVDQADDLHSVLTRLLDSLGREIKNELGHSKARAILGDAQFVHRRIGGRLVGIDECLGAIDRDEHQYFIGSTH